MSAAVEVIAQTLQEHAYDGHIADLDDNEIDCCDCGWNGDNFTTHQADVVAAALGNLTRAWAATFPDGSYIDPPRHENVEFSPGEARATALAEAQGYDDAQLSYRWVGGWTPEVSE